MRRWGALSAVLLLVGGTCLTVGLRGHQQALAGPVAPEHPSRSTTTSTTAALGAPVVARSTPISLSIPAIGLTVSLSTLGLNPDGTVQVPTDIAQPGWFQPGPSPGQSGSAVILGHVDSYQGPAVFFGLRTLEPGDQVAVTLADGVVTDFAVSSVSMYAKAQFPAASVYGQLGYRALQLVTCGGTFDPQTGHYLSNIVVYSSFISATPAAAPIQVPQLPSLHRTRRR